MLLYELKNIKRIVLELTTNCNAMCPGCLRWKGGVLNPIVQKYQGSRGNMSLEVLDNIYCDELAMSNKFQKFVLNGTISDAINSPYLADFVNLIRDKAHKHGKSQGPAVDLHTNGALHSANWWTEFAKIMNRNNKKSVVVFALDGTDNETHQQYRKGCDYNKVIENATAYINAGGKAIWQFIPFEHNQHQLDHAKQLSKELGFDSFLIKNNRGANQKIALSRHKTMFNDKSKSIEKLDNIKVNSVDNSTLEEKHSKRVKVQVKEKKIDYTVEETLDKSIKEIAVNAIKKYDSEDQYLSNEHITCEWGMKGEVNIEWNGTVHPCCHINTGFYTTNYDSVYNNLNNMYEPNFWRVTETKTLKDVLDSKFWNDLQDSWKPDSDTNRKFKRLKACKENCISKELAIKNTNRDILIEKSA